MILVFFLTYLLVVLCSMSLKIPPILLSSESFPNCFFHIAGFWLEESSACPRHIETPLFLSLPTLTSLPLLILIFSILFVPVYSINFCCWTTIFGPVCSNQAISISEAMRCQKKECLEGTWLRQSSLVLVPVFISDLAWNSKKKSILFLTWKTWKWYGETLFVVSYQNLKSGRMRSVSLNLSQTLPSLSWAWGFFP